MTKRLLDLGPRDCKFPVGDPPAEVASMQAFCAKTRIPGKPYCAGCCEIAYKPAPAKSEAVTAPTTTPAPMMAEAA